MPPSKWTYLVVFDERAGPWERFRAFIDSRPEILHWQAYFPSAFFVVTSLTADGLATLLLDHVTKRRGRILVIDTCTDRAGWLPLRAWNIMRKPLSAEEEEPPVRP